MKRKLFLIALFLLMVTQFYSKEPKEYVIKSSDGKQSVNLVGYWKAKDGPYIFTMIFDKDGKMTYGCNNSRAPKIIDLDDDPEGLGQKYNQWWKVGTYKTAGNILIFSTEKSANYSNAKVATGNVNFLVNIVSNDELVIQTSNTGAVRTYERLY